MGFCTFWAHIRCWKGILCHIKVWFLESADKTEYTHVSFVYFGWISFFSENSPELPTGYHWRMNFIRTWFWLLDDFDIEVSSIVQKRILTLIVLRVPFFWIWFLYLQDSEADRAEILTVNRAPKLMRYVFQEKNLKGLLVFFEKLWFSIVPGETPSHLISLDGEVQIENGWFNLWANL